MALGCRVQFEGQRRGGVVVEVVREIKLGHPNAFGRVALGCGIRFRGCGRARWFGVATKSPNITIVKFPVAAQAPLRAVGSGIGTNSGRCAGRDLDGLEPASAQLDNTVGVDLEADFDLRSTTRGRWDAVEVELAEGVLSLVRARSPWRGWRRPAGYRRGLRSRCRTRRIRSRAWWISGRRGCPFRLDN